MEWSLIFNPLWVLFVFAVWVVLVLNAKPLRVISCPSQNINVNRKWIFILFFLVVCVLGLHRWDTYHMPLYWMNDNFTSHFEPFHVWLVVLLMIASCYIDCLFLAQLVYYTYIVQSIWMTLQTTFALQPVCLLLTLCFARCVVQ